MFFSLIVYVIIKVMYLTPELRSGIFNIPKDFLSQAHVWDFLFVVWFFFFSLMFYINRIIRWKQKKKILIKLIT